VCLNEWKVNSRPKPAALKYFVNCFDSFALHLRPPRLEPKMYRPFLESRVKRLNTWSLTGMVRSNFDLVVKSFLLRIRMICLSKSMSVHSILTSSPMRTPVLTAKITTWRSGSAILSKSEVNCSSVKKVGVR